MKQAIKPTADERQLLEVFDASLAEGDLVIIRWRDKIAQHSSEGRIWSLQKSSCKVKLPDGRFVRVPRYNCRYATGPWHMGQGVFPLPYAKLPIMGE